MAKPKIVGGPEARAFDVDKVIPTNFKEGDPFFDVGSIAMNLEKGVRKGKIEDFLVITRGEEGIAMKWRGSNPMTMALGMLSWCRELLFRGEYE